MLKEGWDVTNLYTIVPLRAANSRTLVEQSIGRGLRLPYGKRVGVPAVDRLTIVSHDKFKEIVDHANDPNSIIRAGVVIGRDIPEAGRKAVEVKSTFEHVIAGGEMPARLVAAGQPEEHQGKLFETPEKQAVAKAAYQVIRQYERLRGSDQLQDEEVQAEIVQKVQDLVRPAQGVLTGIVEEVNLPAVVRETTALYQKLSIDVPKIVVVPKGKFVCGYEDFDLDVSGINLQPVSQDILIQHLHENLQYRLRDGTGIVEEKRPEDYLVRGLIDFDDISYDEHSALLYKLAGQVVQRLRMYLKEENDLINVLQYHQQPLVNLIHVQMQKHYVESATAYEAHVTRGFRTLRANNYTAAADEGVRDFRATLPDGQRKNIGAMVFGGFSKCLYPIQKFDSDSERRFAVILENDPDVEKWFKPAKGDFQIHYSHDESYEPDFVVETAGEKFLCEPKRASEMTDEIVLAKAEAAAVWCRHATAHAIENGGKPWRCLLIPHDEIEDQMALAGLAARREVLPKQ
jgi:type III restriction enzyme